MKDSWLIQVSRFFRTCIARFLVRFVAFVVVMQFAIHSPGWARSAVWFLVLLAGIWAFFALIRESGQAMDFLIPRLEQGYRKIAAWSQKHENVWRTITLFCAVGIFAAATYRAWSAWEFMATSSLRTDEIVNISGYTSRGLVPSISDYRRARDHIFFNILTTLLPGADSTLPVRARLISFLSVGGAAAVLVVYAGLRGWLLAGLACAGLLAVNLSTLKVVLEARGYGLIFLCAMVGCTVFAEWLRSLNHVWLKILGISCVLGTYTLPFYIVFGGSLLLLAFAYRPTRETLLMGILSLAAIGILYLPVVGGLYTVFAGYDERYSEETSNFSSFDGVLHTLQYFIPYDLLQPNAFLFVLISVLVLAYISFGRFCTPFRPSCDHRYHCGRNGIPGILPIFPSRPHPCERLHCCPADICGYGRGGFGTFGANSCAVPPACPNRVYAPRYRSLMEVRDLGAASSAAELERHSHLY
jgi:hypothetical protein